LYYRLNVFPIRIPPLRERREDIPQLATHFVRMFAQRHGKVIQDIPSGVIDALTRYHWPGNVRELQNVIERAVVAACNGVLDLPMVDAQPEPRASSTRTLAQVEREHILSTLGETNGVIGGWNGAAAKLGLSRTTLI
jgi:formate hydrogenlyase transcriptional activator